jgi:tetratricopeptide (TPR) repeat protein
LALALEYNPDFVEALTNLGLVELKRGNFLRAEQLLQRSRRLNPDIAQTHHGLGVLAERRYRVDEASDHYRAALAVDPGFADARANLSRLLFEAGLYEHALVEFRLLTEAAPTRLEGYFGLLSSLLALDRTSEAEALLSAVLQRFGEAPGLRLLQGRCLLRRGEFVLARTWLKPLTQTAGPWTASAGAWLAITELALQKPAAAREAADAALRLEPDNPLASYALAIALDDEKSPVASAWLKRALALNPGHPELLRRLR